MQDNDGIALSLYLLVNDSYLTVAASPLVWPCRLEDKFRKAISGAVN